VSDNTGSSFTDIAFFEQSLSYLQLCYVYCNMHGLVV